MTQLTVAHVSISRVHCVAKTYRTSAENMHSYVLYSLILAPVQLSRVVHLLSIPKDNVYSTAQCLFHSTMSIPQDDHASVYYYATQYLPLVHVHIKTSTRIHHRLVEIMRLTKNSSQKFLIRYLYTPIIVSI